MTKYNKRLTRYSVNVIFQQLCAHLNKHTLLMLNQLIYALLFIFLLATNALAIDVTTWNSRFPCLTSNGEGIVRVQNPDPNYIYTVYAIKHDSVSDYLAFAPSQALDEMAVNNPPYAMTSTAGRNNLSDILLGDRSASKLVNPSTGILEDGIYTAYVVSGSYLTLPSFTAPTEAELEQYGWMLATYMKLGGDQNPARQSLLPIDHGEHGSSDEALCRRL